MIYCDTCVNEYDNLIAEIESLRKGLDYSDKANGVLKNQNADLFYAKEKYESEVERLTIDNLELVAELERLSELLLEAQSECCTLTSNCPDCKIKKVCDEVGRITKRKGR